MVVVKVGVVVVVVVVVVTVSFESIDSVLVS